MARTKDAVVIEIPLVMRDRLVRLKIHERQACHEVIEQALDLYEDTLRDGAPSAQVLSGRAESAQP